VLAGKAERVLDECFVVRGEGRIAALEEQLLHQHAVRLIYLLPADESH
jgi:hypothetical protein